MLKITLILWLLALSLFANERVKIYASALQTQENIVRANEGITVIYQDYVLTANSAKYDKDSGDLELFDNIRVSKGNESKILGKYARLNIAKKERLFQPFYMLDKTTELWLSSDEGKAEDQKIDIDSGTLSGCDPMDPIWTVDFSSSNYNTDSKWMNVYNARLYIGDIPLFYTPYIGYSLDTSRRTGLLIPQLGYSQDEGFYYEQPIYIAEQNWWDLELRPQIRTNRGEGVYQTFRFVDGKNSRGEITAGYFQEHNSYYEKYKLKNDSHFGYNIKYDNNDFINQWFGTNFDGQSGIYADVNHMNDVDYINLTSKNQENQSTATQVLSRVNMFYNTDTNYIATYFKYYQDLTKTDNDNTLQKLPTLHYHSYLDTFFDEHLLYSLDVQANNIYRVRNTNVTQTDINLPVILRTSLFDEYLNLSYKANLYMQYSQFRGEGEEDDLNNPLNVEYENGYFARNYHTLSASTQLTKRYEELSHVVGLSLTYNKSGSNTKNGFYESFANATEAQREEFKFHQISNIEDELQIDFSQYLYDNRASQIFYHRLSQRVSYADTGDQLGELENEFEYNITSYMTYYNNMFFNYDENKFSKLLNSINLNSNSLSFSLSHLFKDSFKEATVALPRYTNYLTSSLTYNYNKHYSYSASYNYDLEASEKKNMSVGFMYKKRCWDFGLRYSENRRPILTTTGQSYIDDRYLFVTVILKPLMKQSGNSALYTHKFTNN